ncbi:zinc ribbon domain-containing protein [Butyrivibrio fibrisolvens]|uniref:zinc ribbon domain-containing protein n=1 Tax=Butyrivibrio fibrisolvens TaxID=831 RepID=UPI0003F770CD|nr:zinc ribbon domain-containing protein [Butyrivibrio fibrisolvens]
MGFKIKKISCPHCGAQINMDLKGMSSYYCPYCGQQSSVDDGNRTFTYNYNINQHYTDDAAIETAKIQDRKEKRGYWLFALLIILYLGVPFLLWLVTSLYSGIEEQKKIDAGKIQVGQSSDDMEGQNYRAVVEQLRGAGFKNIVAVDLDDDTWFLMDDEKIANVSIGGDTSFYEDDYFDPEDKIVISYH